MGPVLTTAILVAAFAILAVAIFMNRKPVELGRVRLIPYGGLQFLAIAAILVTLAHLISLLSGQPLIGRSGY